jgi:hypothetical protein
MGIKSPLLAIATASLACLFSFASARAASPVSTGNPVTIPTVVVPNDTFDIDVVGFDQLGDGVYLAGPFSATFGSTQTFPGAGPNGQTVTVTSSENIGPSTTTDTVTISVPSDFIPSGFTINGNPVTEIEMDLGNSNAGNDTLDFVLPITGATYSGSLHYVGGTVDLSSSAQANTVLTNNNMSLETALAASAGGGNLAGIDINSFTFMVMYPTVEVPEPATIGMLFLGAAILGGILFLRRRRA